jgi:sulfur carrier protein
VREPQPTGAGDELQVTVNGEARRLAPPVTLAEVVAAEVPTVRGVAVAVNAALVPRSAWAATALADGDRIELLSAAQGG